MGEGEKFPWAEPLSPFWFCPWTCYIFDMIGNLIATIWMLGNFGWMFFSITTRVTKQMAKTQNFLLHLFYTQHFCILRECNDSPMIGYLALTPLLGVRSGSSPACGFLPSMCGWCSPIPLGWYPKKKKKNLQSSHGQVISYFFSVYSFSLLPSMRAVHFSDKFFTEGPIFHNHWLSKIITSIWSRFSTGLKWSLLLQDEMWDH